MVHDLNMVGLSKIAQDEKLNSQDVLLSYMRASKFETFLGSGLGLTRADHFTKDDPFEAEFTEGIYNLAGCFKITHTNGQSQSGRDELKEECDQIRRESFVSCWTDGTFENVALWRIYGRQGNAVAIKTNVGSLKVQLENFIRADREKELELGFCRKRIIKVIYVDHHDPEDEEKLLGTMPTDVLHFKNKGYVYEKEVRVIFDTYQTPVTDKFGKERKEIFIRVDPKAFIDEILVSPYACNCYFDSIKALLKPYHLAEKVKWSKLKYVPGTQR